MHPIQNKIQFPKINVLRLELLKMNALERHYVTRFVITETRNFQLKHK